VNGAPYIPAKTIEELSASHPTGTRHAAMIKIAVPLIGNGVAPEAVFAQLRATFQDADKTDKEINDVISWVLDKNPTPSGNGNGGGYQPAERKKFFGVQGVPPAPKPTPKAAVAKLIGNWECSPADWSAKSKVEIPRTPVGQTEVLICTLYAPNEKLNIVCRFTQNGEKANPQGSGKLLDAAGWMDYLEAHSVPQSAAGAWMRPNPCNEGTGADGAITDADIASYRFLLVENDRLDMASQLAFLDCSNLAIAAIILSGGSSAHAWVKLDAKSREDYAEKAKEILTALEPFGFDQANKNPSRLSRLAGAKRTIGAKGDGLQSLVYLDPQVEPMTSDRIEYFKEALKTEALPKNPMHQVMLDAGERLDDLIANRGKIGLHIGLPKFDEISGGFRKKQMIILAAESKGGKSALALNIINNVCLHGKAPTAVFSMEMDKDELTDLLICMNGQVNRNHYNTGFFDAEEIESAREVMQTFNTAPLYIFDSPTTTTDEIELRCRKLKRERNLAFVVIDYLQLVAPGNSFRDNREQQIASIGRAIRVMAKNLNVPFLVLSQLNDDGKLRESRAVGHDAHAIMVLTEEDSPADYKAPREMLLKIQRARSMPRGDFKITFQPLFCQMTENEIQRPF